MNGPGAPFVEFVDHGALHAATPAEQERAGRRRPEGGELAAAEAVRPTLDWPRVDGGGVVVAARDDEGFRELVLEGLLSLVERLEQRRAGLLQGQPARVVAFLVVLVRKV